MPREMQIRAGCIFGMSAGVRRRLGAGLAGIVLGMAVACAAAQPFDPICNLPDGEMRSVVRVLDGDTLVVDGAVEVRLIGALAPRAWDAATDGEDWPLTATARSALEGLVLAHSIELKFAGRRIDRYGRLLAQVFVHGPASSNSSPDWVQGAMVRRGLARVYSLEGSSSCLPELLAHERIARDATAGLWALPAYAVRAADDVEHLLQLRGTFQIVEGRVRAVSQLRTATYINFGEDVRQDFTVSIRAQARRQIPASSIDPQQWIGRIVRVRGWIERRGGPLIEIPHPGAVEALTEAGEAAAPATAGPKPRARTRAQVPAAPD